MEPLEFITLFVITGMVMFIIYWLLAEWGKRCLKQFQEYELYYDSLKLSIDNFVITKENYDKLIIRFERLGDMKGGSKERNEVLFREFAERFESVSTK